MNNIDGTGVDINNGNEKNIIGGKIVVMFKKLKMIIKKR